MKLNEIADNPGARKSRMRIGRGIGSGKGKTGGRGGKGQTARAGVAIKGFEGGQMPLHRRLPKRGFTNIFKKTYAIVNIGVLNELEGDSFDFARLVELGVLKKAEDGLKILGSGELKRKISVKVDQISACARQKIEALGGSVELLSAAPAEPAS